MKKILISLLLAMSLLASVALVACGGDGEYDDSEKPQTVEPHPDETEEPGSETQAETDSSLGVAVDTEEGWGEIHR